MYVEYETRTEQEYMLCELQTKSTVSPLADKFDITEMSCRNMQSARNITVCVKYRKIQEEREL